MKCYYKIHLKLTSLLTLLGRPKGVLSFWPVVVCSVQPEQVCSKAPEFLKHHSRMHDVFLTYTTLPDGDDRVQCDGAGDTQWL